MVNTVSDLLALSKIVDQVDAPACGQGVACLNMICTDNNCLSTREPPKKNHSKAGTLQELRLSELADQCNEHEKSGEEKSRCYQ